MKNVGEKGQFQVEQAEIDEIAAQPYAYMAGMLMSMSEWLHKYPENSESVARRIAIVAEAMKQRTDSFIDVKQTPQ